MSAPDGRHEGAHAARPAGTARSAKDAVVISEAQMSLARRRLRGRARRGLLENDLILQRFFERDGDALTADEMIPIEALLDLPENHLLDVLLGRVELPEILDTNELRAMLHRLRAA